MEGSPECDVWVELDAPGDIPDLGRASLTPQNVKRDFKEVSVSPARHPLKRKHSLENGDPLSPLASPVPAAKRQKTSPPVKSTPPSAKKVAAASNAPRPVALPTPNVINNVPIPAAIQRPMNTAPTTTAMSIPRTTSIQAVRVPAQSAGAVPLDPGRSYAQCGDCGTTASFTWSRGIRWGVAALLCTRCFSHRAANNGAASYTPRWQVPTTLALPNDRNSTAAASYARPFPRHWVGVLYDPWFYEDVNHYPLPEYDPIPKPPKDGPVVRRCYDCNTDRPAGEWTRGLRAGFNEWLCRRCLYRAETEPTPAARMKPKESATRQCFDCDERDAHVWTWGTRWGVNEWLCVACYAERSKECRPRVKKRATGDR